VLVTLGQFGVMTGKAIGAHTHMHKTKVSRAVAQLEQRKLLTRRANRDDLREAFLSLSPAGRTVYEEWAPRARAFTDRLAEAVAAADRAAFDRAKVRALAQLVACDIHPLNNVAPLRYLKNELGQDQAKIDAWYHHWVIVGFDALEAMVRPGPYAYGADVTLADICLVPQVANARRLKVPLDRYPKIVAIDAACAKLPAFEQARPDNQPDAE
jgi:glutathione S-transferase